MQNEIPRMLHIPEQCDLRGKSRSSHYNDIAAGLWPKPIPIGRKAVANPETEVAAMQRATIAGASDDEKRALVKKLEAARKAQYPS